jgi:hypothetical protein
VLPRRFGVVLVATLMTLPAIVAAATPADATTFTSYAVNSTADTTGGSLCTVQPPTAATPCTLRAAVAIADTSTGVTINVPAGTYTLTANALNISKPMTIVGAEHQPGATATTIDGGAKDRVFNITATGVTIDGVVARNGAPKNGVGGAIEIAKGAVATITKSTISGSTATQGAGVEVDGTATITQDTFTGNTTGGKGGGIYANGLTTVQNSTFDGNSAQGGGGIAAAANTTVAGSTIVNNSSNNSNGGGLFRNGGSSTFTVTGSILAGNNASNGRDCYGTESFQGTNIVQSVPGCNPTGGTILVTDPQLGPLADNGGPTQTHRPLSGGTPATTSPAIDAYTIPCATAIDQRGIARPQPVGGKCDVGAVEIQPLGLNVALSASPQTIVAGAATVPEANIPPSALIQSPSGAPATQASTFKVATFKVATFKVATFKVATFKVATFKVATFKVATFKVATFKVAAAEAALQAANIPDPLQDVHLSDVTLNLPGGWAAFLAALPPGVPFAGLAEEQITLAQVMPYIESAGLTLGDVDLFDTPLGQLPLLTLLLGGVPLKSIPIQPNLTTDQQRLGEWCNELKTASQDPCTSLGIDPNAANPSSITMLAIALAGFSLDTVLPSQMHGTDIAPNDPTWFQAIPLGAFGQQPTSLSSLTLGSLPPAWVDCTQIPAGVNCGTATLGAYPGAIVPSITLYDLMTNASTVGLPLVQSFTIADLLQGLVPNEDLPWSNIDLTNSSLQNLAQPLQPTVTYTLSVNITGDRAATTSTNLQFPQGFEFAPGSFKVDGTAAPDPTIDPSTNIANLALGTLTPGAHTATIQARAGLTLGASTATATGCAQVGGTCDPATATPGPNVATSPPSQATVNVTEAFENGTAPGCNSDTAACDTEEIAPNTLYLAHISSPTDRDLFHFTVGSSGRTSASIILSNIPQGADYDLELFGPRHGLIGAEPPTQTLNPVNDATLSLYPTDAHVAPDTTNDVALTPPPPQHGEAPPGLILSSANRGNVNEEIDTGSLVPGDYYIQVSGYNGSWSPSPYSLRMSLSTTTPPPCSVPPLAFPDGGTLADSTPLGVNQHVLFVVPQHRLYQTYGAARVDPLIADVQNLAANVGGTILAVDNPDTSAAPAYAAWDQDHCNPDAANAVVHAIASQIDAARNANPQIDTVVLVGDDGVLPMGRVPDGTVIANESNFAGDLQSLVAGPNGPQAANNELSGALDAGYMLTDNVYGVRAGVSVNDHEFFVPDVALGRLVETPEDMTATIDTYLHNSNGGLLDPSTVNSALVTGYDFMADGAQGVANALQKNNYNVDTSLIGNNWAASDLTNKLLGGSAPGVISLNGHMDPTHLLAGDGTSVVDSSTFASDTNAQKLSRRLLFSMGCHSGLSVDDVTIGTEADWPQVLTGAKQGASYAGNTGFGYGDDTSVALSERLIGLYAQALNGSVNVGEALMLAKQQYAATTEVLSPYDEKVVEEFTFYGLPIYKLASAVTQSNATIQALTMSAASNGQNTPLSGTDPRTHLNVASVSQTIDQAHGLNEVKTGAGNYYNVNGQTIQVKDRPIEPRTTIDATQPNLRAHGFVITQLNSSDTPDFNAKYFRPNVDNAATEKSLAPVGDSVFPATLSRVTHAVTGQGSQDLVLMTAGQAQDPAGDGTVTQRLFNSVGGVVEYSTPNDTDFTAPSILRSRGEIVGGTAGFTVDTDGTALRVVVLYKPKGVDGAWKAIDLTPMNLADGSKQWWGGGPITGNDAEFFVQAVDQSGNVGFSTNKVSNFDALREPGSTNLAIAIQPVAGVTQANGWYNGAVTATISGGTGETYSLDGGDFVTYPNSAVTISGDGVHHLLAQDSTTGDFASVDILIDGTGPTVTASVDPGSSTSTTDASNNIWYSGAVTLNITGNDGVVGSGMASLAYHAGNAADTVITDSSSPALVRSPLGDASTSVAVSSTATYTYKGTDVAGNSSAPQALPINIDQTPPVVDLTKCSNLPVAGKWYNSNQTVTCTATDAGVGLLDPSQSTITFTTNVPMGTQTSTASTNSVNVCDRLNNCTPVKPFVFMIDQQNPTITGSVVNGAGNPTPAQDGSGNTWYGGQVTLHLAANDGTDGSNIASITYSSTGVFSAPATVVPSATADVPVNPANDGSSTASYFSTDGAGNNSATGNSVIAIDRTPPKVVCSPPDQTKWYASNQTVNCTASDNGVGLAPGSPAIFALTTSVAPGGVNANAPAAGPQHICDLLQNCTPVPAYTFKIDMQPPAAPTITTPANGAVYTSGQNVVASYSCSDGSGSGIASCIGTVGPGLAIDTTPGTHTFTVTATDLAGNKTVSSVTYNVGYGICYQYNTTQQQSDTGTVVLKVQLCDSAGHNLSSASITLQAVYEDATPGKLPSPNNFPGSSNQNFTFRFSNGTYIYNLDPTAPPALLSGHHELDFIVVTNPPPANPVVYAAPFNLK